MKTNIILTGALLFCLMLSACTSTKSGTDTTSPVVQNLVQKHIEALGGLERLRAVDSVYSTGEVYLPSMSLAMDVSVYQKRPGMGRTVAAVGGTEVIEAYDGETAWTDNPMQGGVQKMTGDQARFAKERADLDGFLVDYESKGYTLSYAGESEVRGVPTERLMVTRTDSSTMMVHLDAESFLHVKTETRTANPFDGSSGNLDIYLEDYRDVDGVMRAFKIKLEMDGTLFQEVTMDDMQVNTEMDDALFTYPKAG